MNIDTKFILFVHICIKEQPDNMVTIARVSYSIQHTFQSTYFSIQTFYMMFYDFKKALVI